MIDSASGSSFEISEFWIRIQAKVPDPTHTYYLIIFGNINKNTFKSLNSIKKKNLPNIGYSLFHTTVLQ